MRVVAPHDHVDERISYELLGVIGGRNTAENDLDVRANLVNPLRDFQAALDVHHPVQVYADETRIKRIQDLVKIQLRVSQQHRGKG